jgi:hypothetical protein
MVDAAAVYSTNNRRLSTKGNILIYGIDFGGVSNVMVNDVYSVEGVPTRTFVD